MYRLLQQAPYHKEGTREFFGVDELVANGTYKAAYPLHDGPYETGYRMSNVEFIQELKTGIKQELYWNY